MAKMEIKRYLLASFIFDLGKFSSANQCPCINVFWEVNNKEKPFTLTIRHNWNSFEVSYVYKTLMKYLVGHSFTELAEHEIKERIPNYQGAFECDKLHEFHLSERGKYILSSQSQEQVERWIKLKQL